MENNRWKDTTTYCQGEKRGEAAPREWTYTLDSGADIIVHKHIWYGDEWLLSSRRYEYSRFHLRTEDIEIAKQRALSLTAKIIAKRIQKYQLDLDEIKLRMGEMEEK